jgi:hypothetical protein
MRAKPFFKTRFRIKAGEGQDHWIGGTWPGKVADCPVCGQALLLIMDFNCESSSLRKAARGKLKAIRRLPLFACLKCLAELSYRVDEKLNVKVVFARHGSEGPSWWYEPYPQSFERKPVVLDSEIPEEVFEAIEAWKPSDIGHRRLAKKHVRVLEEFFQHPMFMLRDLYFHQIGGMALIEIWDEEAFACRAPRCPGRELKVGRPMRFLAGVLNDPPGGLPLYEELDEKTAKSWNYGISHYWQICDKCLSITTFSTCD